MKIIPNTINNKNRSQDSVDFLFGFPFNPLLWSNGNHFCCPATSKTAESSRHFYRTFFLRQNQKIASLDCGQICSFSYHPISSQFNFFFIKIIMVFLISNWNSPINWRLLFATFSKQTISRLLNKKFCIRKAFESKVSMVSLFDLLTRVNSLTSSDVPF